MAMKTILSDVFGVQSRLSFLLTLLGKGRRIGTDPAGNTYYTGRPRRGYSKERRWVVMRRGGTEATLVPPEYHGWLHHQQDRFPDAATSPYRKVWQAPPAPNLTGTDLAYRPPGHLATGAARHRARGDYEPWTPDMNDKEQA